LSSGACTLLTKLLLKEFVRGYLAEPIGRKYFVQAKTHQLL